MKERLSHIEESHQRFVAFLTESIEGMEVLRDYIETDALSHVITALRHGDVESLDETLGNANENLANYQRAADYLNLAIDEARSEYGEDSAEVSILLQNLGVIRLEIADFESAIQNFQRALEIQGNAKPNHIEQFVNLRYLIGRTWYCLGYYHESASYFSDALNRAKAQWDEKHPTIQKLYNSLGLAFMKMRHLDAAEYSLLTARSIAEELYGQSHPSVAFANDNLGSVAAERGLWIKALHYYKAALASFLSNYGTSHPNVAASQSNIGSIYMQLGDFERAVLYHEPALKNITGSFGAEDHYSAALDMSLALFGPDDSLTMEAQKGLATAREAEGTSAIAE